MLLVKTERAGRHRQAPPSISAAARPQEPGEVGCGDCCHKRSGAHRHRIRRLVPGEESKAGCSSHAKGITALPRLLLGPISGSMRTGYLPRTPG